MIITAAARIATLLVRAVDEILGTHSTPNASSADLQPPLPEQGAFGLLVTFQLARTGDGGGVLLQDTDRGGSLAAPVHGS